MRWFLLVLAMLAASPALAKPKAAVAPLDGDDDAKVTKVVADAAGDHAKVTSPDRVAKAMDNLSITTFKTRDLKKLRSNLEVDVIIHGAVTKDGGKKHLALTISGKGKQKEMVELDYKSTKTLRKQLSSALGKKLDAAAGGGDDNEADDDDDAPKRPFADKASDDDKPKKHDDDEDKPKKHASDDEDRPKKHASDDDRPRKRTADADVRKHSDDDDDRPRKRKHHRGDDDDEDVPAKNEITQAAAWVDAGGNFTRHTLKWAGAGTMKPPGVGTAAGAAAVEGELYPFSSDPKTKGAGVGLYGDFSYAMGLGIAVPGAGVTAPIKQEHYQIGARYRLAAGQSSIAFGASYWRRTYTADRSKLMMPTQLDTPDIDYTAVAPGVLARIAAAPKVGVVLGVDVPLMLDGGPIVKAASYGAATILAADVLAGLQILVAPHFALQLRGDLNYESFTFAAKAQSGAATRGVSSATEMNYGVTATIGVLY
ncbi:MAG: hypothetical protein JO257_18790 [Deltaproteobacteria bacterium]|nr:hypothetical protein [Deltaproteobacteria bacterium]